MQKKRCTWCLGDSLYERYHDTEWGVPVYDDAVLFEFLILETMQAGLSWITILRKRENYKAALDQFDVQKIASYDTRKKVALLNNAGIIRHRLKIESIVNNAQAFIDIQKRCGSFSFYLWGFVNGKPIINQIENNEEAPSNTRISDLISRDLKRQGFKFVGSTTIYAFMQAVGMVNDHDKSCFRYEEV
jgi:DNA-3-methyladenine glycosylase I